MSAINSSTTPDVSQCCCACMQEPTTTRSADGGVVYESEYYTIKVSDRGEVNVHNKETGEEYRVWGDPHVDVDGEHAFDFWGQTTFTLDHGTKITFETVPWNGNENMTVASKVTITEGDYGVHVTGVDPNTRGDLDFVETNGYFLDAVVRDGNTIYENPFGSGFLGVDNNGNVSSVDQNFINGTDESKANELVNHWQKFLQMYAGVTAITIAGTFLSAFFQLGVDLGRSDDPPNPFLFTLVRNALDAA